MAREADGEINAMFVWMVKVPMRMMSSSTLSNRSTMEKATSMVKASDTPSWPGETNSRQRKSTMPSNRWSSTPRTKSTPRNWSRCWRPLPPRKKPKLLKQLENKSNFLSLYFQCFFSSMLFTKKHLFSFLFFFCFSFHRVWNVCCGERRLGPQQDTRC